MSREAGFADLMAEISALRAAAQAELKNLNARLSRVEATQQELVRVATQGKAGLRVLLWIGGFVSVAVAALASFWEKLSGS